MKILDLIGETITQTIETIETVTTEAGGIDKIDKFAKDLLTLPPDPSFLDRLWFGFVVMLIGMLIVFAVLVLLWGILEVFGFIAKKIMRENKNKFNEEKPGEIITQNTAPVIINPSDAGEAVEQEEGEDELIAVIAAAVSSVLKKPVSDFRVVSFKKRSNWR